MEKKTQDKIESIRLALGCASIVAVVGLASIGVTLLGLAQMA